MSDSPGDAIDVASTDSATPRVSTEIEPSVADLTPARVDHGALITAAAPREAIIEAFNEYARLVDTVVDKKDDYQAIGSKSFMKKSGLRKLAVVFGVSYELIDRVHERDAEGRLWRSEFTVRATAPNGRFMEGYGACSIWDRCQDHYADCVTVFDSDKPKRKLCDRHCGGKVAGCDGFHHFSKPEHDIPATAETRAKNRAGADLFAMGQVSAEEVDSAAPENLIASREQIAAIIAAAKALKAAGGNPGTWPVVLGVAVVERFFDESDNEWHQSTLITADVAAELVMRLEGAIQPAADTSEIDGAGSGSAPDTARTDQAETTAPEPVAAPEPAVVETPAPEPVAAPPAPGKGAPSAPVASEQGARAEGDGAATDKAENPTSGGTGSDTEPVAAPPPAPTPAPVAEPSAPGERARLAMGLKEIWGDSHGDEARAVLVNVITRGRTSSAKELTKPEVHRAIKASNLLASGHLVFGIVWRDADGTVRDPDGIEALNPLGLPVLPEQEPTLIAAVPEGTDAPALGDVWVTEFTEFLQGGA